MNDIMTVAGDGRYRLQLQRHLGYHREKVWAVLLRPDRVTSPLACLPTPGCGGHIRFAAPRLIDYRCGPTRLRWKLLPTGTGRCTLVFTHTCPDRDEGIARMGWWLTGLDVLAADLSGHPVPDISAAAALLDRRCRSAFGLTPPPAADPYPDAATAEIGPAADHRPPAVPAPRIHEHATTGAGSSPTNARCSCTTNSGNLGQRHIDAPGSPR